MQIKSLTLKNFRGFKDTEIAFSEGLTVLVGVNGAGKSSVLDALAKMLSWAVARVRTENGSGNRMEMTDIRNGAEGALVSIRIVYSSVEYGWALAGSVLGRKREFRSDWAGVAKLSEVIQERLIAARRLGLAELLAPFSLPIMVYYQVGRSVASVPFGVPNRRQIFESLETYESALAGSSSFNPFFEWFRAREDLENENRARIDDIAKSESRDLTLAEVLMKSDRQLGVVRSALQEMLPGFNKFGVRRQESAMVAEKNGNTIRIDQLSDGEKCLIAMVGDLARRLSLANPVMKNPLDGEGVVLIDEIELHLHPAWQRTIIGKLRQTFPNVQFIVSTHSPQVLGEVEHDCIRRITIGEDGSPVISTPSQSLGLDANLILEELFGAPSRNKQVATELTNIFREIDKEDAKSLAKARREIKKLKKKLNGEIPDLVEAEAMLFMLENN